MSQRVPTQKQYGQLRMLGSGAMVLAPGRREWTPLLRRGWVVAESEDDGHRGFLPPLRITADGLRALAAAVDRYGLPELNHKPQHVAEHPAITKLRADLEDTTQRWESVRRDVSRSRVHVTRIRRLFEEMERDLGA